MNLEDVLAAHMAEDAIACKKRQKKELRRSEALTEDSGTVMHSRTMTQRRAKKACAGCDNLLPPDDIRLFGSDPSCSPACDEKLKRWRRYRKGA